MRPALQTRSLSQLDDPAESVRRPTPRRIAAPESAWRQSRSDPATSRKELAPSVAPRRRPRRVSLGAGQSPAPSRAVPWSRGWPERHARRAGLHEPAPRWGMRRRDDPSPPLLLARAVFAWSVTSSRVVTSPSSACDAEADPCASVLAPSDHVDLQNVVSGCEGSKTDVGFELPARRQGRRRQRCDRLPGGVEQKAERGCRTVASGRYSWPMTLRVAANGLERTLWTTDYLARSLPGLRGLPLLR